MHTKVLLLAGLWNLYFDSHNHTLHCSNILYLLYESITSYAWNMSIANTKIMTNL